MDLSESLSKNVDSRETSRLQPDSEQSDTMECNAKLLLHLSELNFPSPALSDCAVANYTGQPVGPDSMMNGRCSESVMAGEAALQASSLFVGAFLVGEWLVRQIVNRIREIWNGQEPGLKFDENIETMIDCRKEELEYSPYIQSVVGETIVGYLSYQFRKAVCEVREIAAKDKSSEILIDLVVELKKLMKAAGCEEVISIVISDRDLEYGKLLTSLGFNLGFYSEGRNVDGDWQDARYWFQFDFADRAEKLFHTLSSADIYQFIPSVHMRDLLRMEKDVSVCPWSEADFMNWRRNPDSLGMVVVLDASPVGYCFYKIEKGKPHIVKLGVDPCVASRYVIQDRILNFVGKDPVSGNQRQVIVDLSDDVQMCVDDQLTWFRRYAETYGLSAQIHREGGPQSPQVVILKSKTR